VAPLRSALPRPPIPPLHCKTPFMACRPLLTSWHTCTQLPALCLALAQPCTSKLLYHCRAGAARRAGAAWAARACRLTAPAHLPHKQQRAGGRRGRRTESRLATPALTPAFQAHVPGVGSAAVNQTSPSYHLLQEGGGQAGGGRTAKPCSCPSASSTWGMGSTSAVLTLRYHCLDTSYKPPPAYCCT